MYKKCCIKLGAKPCKLPADIEREEEVEKILSKLKPKEATQSWGYYLKNKILP